MTLIREQAIVENAGFGNGPPRSSSARRSGLARPNSRVLVDRLQPSA
jgi:hypothetical protein